MNVAFDFLDCECVYKVTTVFFRVTEGYESEDTSSELLSFGFEVVFPIPGKCSNIMFSFRISLKTLIPYTIFK